MAPLIRVVGRSLLRGLWWLVLAALAAGVALRLAVWLAPPITVPVERILGAAMGTAVELERAELAWQGVRPGVILEGLRLGEAPALTAVRVQAELAPLATLGAGDLRWAAVAIDGLRLALEEGQGGWSPAGEAFGTLLSGEAPVAPAWLPRRLQVRDARLLLAPQQGAKQRSATFELVGHRQGERLRLGAKAVDGDGVGEGLRGVAEAPLHDLGAARVYARLEAVPLSAWGALLAGREVTGTASGELWLALAEGRPDALYGTLRGDGLGLAAPAADTAAGVGFLGEAALQLRFSGRSWRGELRAEEAELSWPGRFSEPIPWHEAKAELGGRWAAHEGWSLRADAFRATNEDLQVRGRLGVRAEWGGEPRVFLRASADELPVARVPAYVPEGVTPPSVRAWLEQGLRGGMVQEAELLFAGPPSAFPFDDHEGVFQARAEVVDGVLRYGSAWPRITEIDAQLRWDGAGFVARGAGRARGVDLTGVRAQVDDLREPVLAVSGRGDGDARDALGFLADSPLGRGWLGDAVPLSAHGPVGLDLSLRLPLVRGRSEEREVDGRVSLQGVEAEMGDWITMEALQGAVRFDTLGVHAEEALTGRWGGEAARVELQTARLDGQRRILLDATGFGSPASLIPAVANDPPWLAGGAPWQVRARLPAFQSGDEPEMASVRIRSSLAGLRLGLPEPLGLSAGEQRDLQVDLGFTRQGLCSYWLHYGEQLLRAGAAAGSGGAPRALAVQLGPGVLRLPPRGVRLLGRLETLDLDAWRRWLAQRPLLPSVAAAPRTGATGWWPPLPVEGHLLIGDLRWGARDYGQQIVVLDAPQQAPGLLALRGDLASGEVHWEPGLRAVRAELAHLDLPLPRGESPDEAGGQAAQAASLPAEGDATGWPTVEARIDSLRLEGRSAGSGRVRLHSEAGDLVLEQARLHGPALALSVNGAWRNGRTVLRGRLHSEDIGDVLSLLGAPRAVTLAEAEFGAELGWAGPPWRGELERLAGDVQVRMRDGRITEVDPGAGRLVGLLGLRMLPRRILLDFGDLFGEGLPFDTLDGRLTAASGEGRIRDLRIAGPAARVTISGSVDLGARTYDNHVRVDPRVSAVLPLLGALFGGGAGVVGGFVADQLLGDGVDRAAAVHYRVLGPWHAPRVFRIGVEDASQR
ncbi:MAG: YhdP family protein [Halorhodospira sp.]